VREAAHPLQGTDRALAGADGEREELGDRRELGEHPPFAAVGRQGQPLVASDDPASRAAEDHQDDGQHRRAPDEDGESAEREPEQSSTSAPQHLLGPEALDIGRLPGALLPTVDRGGTAEDALNAGGEVGDHGPEDPDDGHARTAPARALVQQAGWPRGVAQVRLEPLHEPRAPAGGHSPKHQGHPEGGRQADEGARPGPAGMEDTNDEVHRSTRSSSGRRPIRTITR